MLKDLVLKNRSYRGYDSKRKIEKEELLDMADCARLCPSSVNMQPFRYFLLWEEEKVKKVQSLTKWARGLPEMQLPHPGMEPTGFIIILQDTNVNSNLNRFQKDCGIVAQTMLLRAAEMGLGGCMIGNFGAQNVREALNLPEHLSPLLIIALGKPAENIILTEIEGDGSTSYYRDTKDNHYVPKRKLEDIVLF